MWKAAFVLAAALLPAVVTADSRHGQAEELLQVIDAAEDDRTVDDRHFSKPVPNLGGGDDKDGDEGGGGQNKGDTTSFTQGNFDDIYLLQGSYDKIMVLFMENCDYYTMKSYMSSTLSKSYYITNYYGVGYPSQPNYIGILGGSTFGVNNDDQVYLNYNNIVDQLENQGYSWKAYFESYSGNCDLSDFICESGGTWQGTRRDEGEQNGNRWGNRGRRRMEKEDDKEGEGGQNNGEHEPCYARKHNGFFAYTDITGNNDRCSKVVNEQQWANDWKNNDMSNFMWYTPNLVNNGHDTGCQYGASYLESWLDTYFYGQEAMQDVLLFVTWEADNGKYNNHVMGFFPTDDNHKFMTSSVSGNDANSNPKSYASNHFSMLKLIQENFGLDTLGRYDTWSNPIVMPYVCDDGKCIGSYQDTSRSQELEAMYAGRPTLPDTDDSSSVPSLAELLPWNSGAPQDVETPENDDAFLHSLAFKTMVSASFLCVCMIGFATCRACCRQPDDKNEPLLGVTRSDSLLSHLSRASLMSHGPSAHEKFSHVSVNQQDGFVSVHRTLFDHLGSKKALNHPLDSGMEWESDHTLPQSEDIASNPWFDPQNLTQDQFSELLKQENLMSDVDQSVSNNFMESYQPPMPC